LREPLKKSQTEGLSLLILDTDRLKCWVHEKIRWPLDVPGGWYLPNDVSDDYVQQMISESRLKAASGRVVWKRRGANHYWDAECMQAAAAIFFNASNTPERDRGGAPTPQPVPVDQSPPPSEPPVEPEPPRPPDSEGMKTIGVLPEPGSPWNVPAPRHQLFDQHNRPKTPWVQRPNRGPRWNDPDRW
jgi:phage terminase large subunit GpA-like protein